jgi:hypothetical protein
MPSPEVKLKIQSIFNQYSQQFDLIQGPQVRHQFSQFLEELKDLPDNEFLQKVNERYGFLFDFLYKQKILNYLYFFKIGFIVIFVVPVVIAIVYNLFFK